MHITLIKMMVISISSELHTTITVQASSFILTVQLATLRVVQIMFLRLISGSTESACSFRHY